MTDLTMQTHHDTHLISSDYHMSGRGVVRQIEFGELVRTSKIFPDALSDDAWSTWWSAFIRGKSAVSTSGVIGNLSVIDLFGSAGGLSLGLREAISGLGFKMASQAAVDLDLDALGTYRANFEPRRIFGESVSNLIDMSISGTGPDRRLAYRPKAIRGMEEFQDLDLLIGGPPCQGHSSLNNVTRGNDTRNDLYLTMPALAIALNAKSVIIENVPRVVKDGGQVVQAAEEIFKAAGYFVSSGVLSASELGWPQTRARHFMIASQVKQPADVQAIALQLARAAKPLSWLIGDLEQQFDHGDSIFDTVPKLSADNVRRIDWLFENEEYDLINRERPKCHQDGHSYPSVYGRLRYDRPAQTLTTGFQSPGRGRYVHPTQRRVLTIREAARIQGFPDTFQFVNAAGGSAPRGNLQKWIGDAVPSILGYTAGLIALETLV